VEKNKIFKSGVINFFNRGSANFRHATAGISVQYNRENLEAKNYSKYQEGKKRIIRYKLSQQLL